MENFLNQLYSYEYFGFYLILSIIILIILFVIILFFGKKDQKVREIEATKKLQQINNEAFKEENTEEKLEVKESLENTIVVPTVEDIPLVNNEEKVEENIIPVVEESILQQPELEVPQFEIPVIEEKQEEQVNEMLTHDTNSFVDNIENKLPQVENVVENIEEPLLDRIEEKPFAFDNTITFEENFIKPFIETSIKEEPKVLEKQEDEEIKVPEFNFDEIVKDVEEVKQNNTYTKGPQIFSSVYVPEKKEEPVEEKQEIKVEEKIEMPKPTVEEELDFELPTLKKEEVKEEPKFEDTIQMPELNDYNLDELSGETYMINK